MRRHGIGAVALLVATALLGCSGEEEPGSADGSVTTLAPTPEEKSFVVAAQGIEGLGGRSAAELIQRGRLVCDHAANGDGQRKSQEVLINDDHVHLDDQTGQLARLAVTTLCPDRQTAVDDAIAFDRLMKGGSGAPATTAPPGGSSGSGGSGSESDLCRAARAVRDLDDESNATMNDTMGSILEGDTSDLDAEFRAAIAAMSALLPELTAHYDDLEAAVPAEYKADVRTLSDFTESFMRAMAEATSIEDLMRVTNQIDQSEAMAAASATLRLDELTRRECGIVIAN